MRIILGLISLVVPSEARPRWLEEWRAELEHGRRTMLFGALPDAWAMRRVSGFTGRPPTGSSLLQGFSQDLRYARRSVLAAPAFAAAVAGSLSIGIAANVAGFSVVNAAFFRAFPGVSAQDQLVTITISRRIDPRFAFAASGYEQFALMRERLTTLHDLAAHHVAHLAVATNGATAQVTGGLVSGNYFDVLGARPSLGRFFTPDEDAEPMANPAAVISHRFWTEQFGGDASVLGRTMQVNGTTVRIVGVTAEGFFGTRKGSYDTDVWIPFSLSELALRAKDGTFTHISRADTAALHFVGRMQPEASLERVRAEASVVAAALPADPKKARLEVSVALLRLNSLSQFGLEAAAMMAVPLLVLALACINAGTLLLGRATQRSGEWTVRLTLGASRWRAVRQILIEGLLLAGVSGLFGVAFSYGMSRWQESLIPLPLPIDLHVIAYTIAISGVAAVGFALGPALAVTRAAISRGMVPKPGRRDRARGGLIAVQAALSLGLMATGTQFIRTVYATAGTADGLRSPGQVLWATFDLSIVRYAPPASEDFYARLLARASALPDVRSAGLTDFEFFGDVEYAFCRMWLPDDPPERAARVNGAYSAGDLFAAVQLQLMKGRTFTAADANRQDVVVVNEPFAAKHFGGDALGRRIRIAPTDASYAEARDATIVGVVAGPTTRRSDSIPTVFYSSPLRPAPALSLLLETRGSSSETADALRRLVREIDPGVPFVRLTTLHQAQLDRNAEVRWVASSVVALGGIALLLAAGGLAGIVSYVVALRQKEIGIRMALGAPPGEVVRLIIRQTLVPTLLGAALGAGAAAATGQLIQSQVFGASGADLSTLVSVTLLMVGAMLVASWLPARRAGRVDPVEALRAE